MTSSFNPNWAVAPWSTISHRIKSIDLSRDDFRYQIGLTQEDFDKLTSGDLIIDEDLAQKLSNVIGGSTAFWLERDRIWNERKNMDNMHVVGNDNVSNFQLTQEELFKLKYFRERLMRLSYERDNAEKELQAEIQKITVKYSEQGMYEVSGNLSLDTGVGQRTQIEFDAAQEDDE